MSEMLKPVCLYLRYSDRSQTEQSIEGQQRVCMEYCERNKLNVVEVYVDRATSGRSTEKRVEFKRMMRDSEKKMWNGVVVYKLDRFARNRYDSATHKARLKKNGVKVISATENLSDNPESIILEAVLEGMAEFYSAELSQKITRGMHESALKANSVGGSIPLGYVVENKKLVIDPATAPLVQEAFQRYAAGETVADICRSFNSRGYRTAKGAEFNRGSFKSIFKNEKYIGVYTHKEVRIEGGVPAIVTDELFEQVQARLSLTGEAPARGKAKVEYLLSGKLFCGHCGSPMNGESGTGNGGKYNYYSCYSRKRKRGCDKKPLRKDYIEELVARDALEILTDEMIEELADMAVKQTVTDLQETTNLPELLERNKEVSNSISNIARAIEKGTASDTLMKRLTELEIEKRDITKQIDIESKYVYLIEKPQVIYWLNKFKDGDIRDDDFRRRLVDMLVNSVTVWDEPDGYRITTAYNLEPNIKKTYRVDKNSNTKSIEGFGLGEHTSTIGSQPEA